MKKIIPFAASILALTATTSCKDDYDTYFTDISIEDCVSVWYVESGQFWGTEMNGDWVRENFDGSYFISFHRDGTGVAYHRYYEKQQDTESVDSACFTYKTEDACHFDISTAEGERTISFAKESLWAGGRRTTNCVIYWKEKEYEREIYRWHRCREMRTDTALLIHRDCLRGRLSVPKERIWMGKSIVGEYENDGESDPKYERLEFHNDGRFVFNNGNNEMSHRPERRGEYRVAVGEKRDSIFFKFDNGQEDEAYHVIFDWNGAFLYKDGALSMELRDNNRECGY